MPYTLNPTGFAALALSPGMLSEDAFIFLAPDSGVSGLLTAYLNYHSGTVKPLYSIRQTYSVLNGSGSPTSGIGYSGDLYIDTFNNSLYGPKTDDTTWPTGYTSLIGPSGVGVTGIAGASGAVGQGVPASGIVNQVLAKSSNTSYDTEWKDVIDIFNFPKSNNIRSYKATGRITKIKNVSSQIDQICSMCFDPATGTYLLCPETGMVVYQYSRSFDFIRKINLTGTSGNIYSIKKITNQTTFIDSFIVLYDDGVATTKVKFFQLPDLTIGTYNDTISAGLYDIFDTGIPTATSLRNLTYNPRTDTYYFCSENESGGVWNLYMYRDSVVSVAYDMIGTFFTDGVSDNDYGVSIIHGMEFNPANNTILFYCVSGGSFYYMYQMGVDSEGVFTEIVEDGISLTLLDSSDFADLSYFSDFSACFMLDQGIIFLVDLYSGGPAELSATCFSKSEYSPVFTNRYTKGLGSHGGTPQATIIQKVYQQIDTSTTTSRSINFSTSNQSFSSADSIGSPGTSTPFVTVGQTLRSESYGYINVLKDSSIFPRNSTSSTANSTSTITGAYYLALPSGLSAPWKYTTEIVCKGRLSTGDSNHTYKRVIFGHFEVFSTPKIELFYTETGSMTERTFSTYLTPSFQFAASGSGTLELYNNRLYFS